MLCAGRQGSGEPFSPITSISIGSDAVFDAEMLGVPRKVQNAADERDSQHLAGRLGLATGGEPGVRKGDHANPSDVGAAGIDRPGRLERRACLLDGVDEGWLHGQLAEPADTLKQGIDLGGVEGFQLAPGRKSEMARKRSPRSRSSAQPSTW